MRRRAFETARPQPVRDRGGAGGRTATGPGHTVRGRTCPAGRRAPPANRRTLVGGRRRPAPRRSGGGRRPSPAYGPIVPETLRFPRIIPTARRTRRPTAAALPAIAD